MHPLNLPTTHLPLEARLKQPPLQVVPDAPAALSGRLLHRMLPKRKSPSSATLLSRLTAWVSTLQSRTSLPRSSESSPISLTPDQDMTSISTMPSVSTLKCLTIMRMSSRSSTKKERTKCEPELGMKRKRDNQSDPELLISMTKRMRERMKVEETLSLKRDQTTMLTKTMDQGLQRGQGLMNRSSHGSLSERLVEPSSIQNCNSPWNLSKITPSISRQPIKASPIPQNVQNSPRSNGSLSWQERPSILTLSSQPTIQP